MVQGEAKTARALGWKIVRDVLNSYDFISLLYSSFLNWFFEVLDMLSSPVLGFKIE